MDNHYETLRKTFADWICEDLDTEIDYSTDEKHDIINGLTNLYAVAQAYRNNHDMATIDRADVAYQNGQLEKAYNILSKFTDSDRGRILTGHYVGQL